MKMLAIYSILFLSCAVNSKTVIGSYKSEVPSFLNNLFTTNCYLKNLSIELFKDSTFKYNSCAQVSEGNWWVVEDTLFMKCQSINLLKKNLIMTHSILKGSFAIVK